MLKFQVCRASRVPLWWVLLQQIWRIIPWQIGLERFWGFITADRAGSPNWNPLLNQTLRPMCCGILMLTQGNGLESFGMLHRDILTYYWWKRSRLAGWFELGKYYCLYIFKGFQARQVVRDFFQQQCKTIYNEMWIVWASFSKIERMTMRRTA